LTKTGGSPCQKPPCVGKNGARRIKKQKEVQMINAMYSAVLSPHVRYHQQLSAEARLIFCEMTACVDDKQVMDGDEAYFARELNIPLSLVGKAFGELKNYGFVKPMQEGQIWVNV
jgi:hypothetical protein